MRGKGLSSLMVFAIGAAFAIFQAFLLGAMFWSREAKETYSVDDLMFQSMFMFLPALFGIAIGGNNINKKKLYHQYALAGVIMLMLAILLGIIQTFIGYNSIK